jgi:hypothetical protein
MGNRPQRSPGNGPARRQETVCGLKSRVIPPSLKCRQIRYYWNFPIATANLPALTSSFSFSFVSDPEHVESVSPGNRSLLLRTRFVQIFDIPRAPRTAISPWPDSWLASFLPWFSGTHESHDLGGCGTDDRVLRQFLAAHSLLIAGKRQSADRQIAEAIASLSASRNLIPAELTYGWLVIAANSAAGGDFEAMRTWTRQAVRAYRTLPHSAQKQHLHRLSGDLLSLQSCAAVAGRQPEEAVQLLTDAMKCHQVDSSPDCQALDLLLRSRCFGEIGLREEAATDLRRAEGLLKSSWGNPVSRHLGSTIRRELECLRIRHGSFAPAAWN